MVSIPVRLVPAVRRRSISFNQLDKDTMSRIRYRKVAEATGEEVPSDQIVKAAEVGQGEYVVITDEDLAPLAPVKSKQIELETFVPAEDVDPLMFDASYYVVPDKTAKPYALLASAMAGSGRVAIGRFVMRQKEYLAAVRSDGEHLTLSTLVFPDELVSVGSIEEFEDLDGVDVSDKELKMARSLVEAMSEDFQPEQYQDEYRTAVEELIEQKLAGRVPVAAVAEPKQATVIDLAAALEASLKDAASAKSRHPSSGAATKGAARGATKQTKAKPSAARGDAARHDTREAEAKPAKRAAARTRKSA
jgi:DNA end-binding protein Ku